MSNTITPLQATLRKSTGGRVFSCLKDLLAYYARTAPGRDAILAPGCIPLTYGALSARVNDVVRDLRSLGVSGSDRVAVVLPNGPEAAVAMIAVATAAVCVPLNPSFTAEEWQRYFDDLQIAALLTRADMDSASRGVAHVRGIPVIDLRPQPSKGAGAFGVLPSETFRRAADKRKASADKDAFVLLTSGTSSRPKLVPLTHASICRSAYNAGAVLQLGPQDRLLNVMPLFHAHGLISGTPDRVSVPGPL